MMERKTVKLLLIPLFVPPPAQAWLSQGSCSSALSYSPFTEGDRGRQVPHPEEKKIQRGCSEAWSPSPMEMY